MSENGQATARTIFALQNLKGIGRVSVRKIVLKAAGDLVSFPEIARREAQALLGRILSDEECTAAWSKAGHQLEDCSKLGLKIYLWGEDDYPALLRRLSDPPAILFALGGDLNKQEARIALIGTRKNSPWGEEIAQKCAAKIVEEGAIVVSGLALGIDTIGQATVVEQGGATWAVLAHGLHTVSPKSNSELAERIVEGGGTLISEYFPGERAQRSYFVERDRIQAGLSQAILVIESGLNGGSLHTIRFGREAGVPIWTTFPSDMSYEDNPSLLPSQQQGTAKLLVDGAKRVHKPSDLSRLVGALSAPTEASSPAIAQSRLF